MKRAQQAVISLLGVLAAIGFGGSGASAGQQAWSSQYMNWTSDGAVADIYNIDQVLWLPRPGPSTFWPMQWTFKGSGSGGYVGLQEGDTAQDQDVRFSIWDATKSKGLHCQPFGGEGIGQTCLLKVKIDPKRFYRLRLWRLQGQWWGAWLIQADANGVLSERMIGQIRAPATATAPDPASVTNFAEYFGPSFAACSSVPLTVAGYTPPVLNYQGSGVYLGHYTYAGSQKADGNLCATGNETVGAFISAKPYDFGFAQGVMTFLGATLDKHHLSPIKHPTPAPLPNN